MDKSANYSFEDDSVFEESSISYKSNDDSSVSDLSKLDDDNHHKSDIVDHESEYDSSNLELIRHELMKNSELDDDEELDASSNTNIIDDSCLDVIDESCSYESASNRKPDSTYISDGEEANDGETINSDDTVQVSNTIEDSDEEMVDNVAESDDSLHSIDYTDSAIKLSRKSDFTVNDLLSSTRFGAPDTTSRFVPFDESMIRTPRKTRAIIDSSSEDESSPIILINSDSENEVSSTGTTRKLIQPTLHEILDSNASNNSIQSVQSPSTVMQKVSLQEYSEQQKKVLNLKAEMEKATSLFRVVELKALPDKGKLLTDRHNKIISTYKSEDTILRRMVVHDEDLESPKMLKPASMRTLQDVAGAVQPRTFGKQAMATLNLQKALTMDRLEQLHGSLKTCPTEEHHEADPEGVVVDLMPHQRQALAWLVWREKQKPSGGILADDMGLGKTLTMIALMLKSFELEEGQDMESSDDDADEENRETPRVRCKYNGGTLVVCPASLISQWSGEMKNRLKKGMASVELYHGLKRELKAKRLAKYDMVITTFAIVMHEVGKKTPLFNIKWRRVILDEAHQVRNYKSQTSEAVCKLSAKSRWALTGTPIHNKELDLYALLKFLRCSPFDDLTIWKRWVTNKNTGGQDRLNTVMSSLMLRRTKLQLQEKGTLNCLPDRKWELIELHLEKQEMDVYQKILIFSKTLFSQFLHQRAEKNQDQLEYRPTKMNDPNGEYYKMHKKLIKLHRVKDIKQHEILVLLLRLRQVCCHPSLITAMLEGEINVDDDEDDEQHDALNLIDQLNKLNLSEDEDEPSTSATENESGQLQSNKGVGLAEASRGLLNPAHPIFKVDRPSTKIAAVLVLLKEQIIPKGDKAIVVSQWTSLLKLLAIHFELENIAFQQLDGTVPVPKRAAMIDSFNNPNDPARVLLLSLTAGGVGLNLIGANHLLLLDLHWNPQLEMQAQDRIYRVGQKKPVFIYKFMALDTIEERIKSLQDSKKTLAEGMLTGAKMQSTKLSMQDLKMLFNM